jgi:hypothetical protein
MPDLGNHAATRFAVTFPARFAGAMADAQGVLAGIASAAERRSDGALIDPEAMRRLHEIYRLRVELEIETAAVLWRTAEVVSAMADVLDLLSRRRPAGVAPGARFPGLPPEEVERRRAHPSVGSDPAARRASWPEFGGRPQSPELGTRGGFAAEAA